MIEMSKPWHQVGFKNKYAYPSDNWRKLKEKGIHNNARKSPSLNAKKFKTVKQAEKYIASLPKELQKYYKVRTLFGLFL
jgi:hypothetical protein